MAQITRKLIPLATQESKGPLGSLSLVIKSGTRSVPAASLWKDVLIRSTPDQSVTKWVRSFELRGDALYTQTTRDHLIVTSHFLRDSLYISLLFIKRSYVVPAFLSLLANPKLEVYQLRDAMEAIEAETHSALSDPCTLAWENLHKVAFRTGLGNSAFLKFPGSVSMSDMNSFASTYFSSANVSLVGHNVNHQDLSALVDSNFPTSISKEPIPTPQSTYSGGESRVDTGPDSSNHYILAYPGVGYGTKLYPAQLVLSQMLGGAPRVHYGTPTGLLGKLSVYPLRVTAFSKSYSDAGLIGIEIHSSNASIKETLIQSKSVLKKVASGDFTQSELVAGRHSALLSLDCGVEGVLDSLAYASFSKNTFSSGDLFNVSKDHVVELAQAFVKSKPCISAVGSDGLPFADQI